MPRRELVPLTFGDEGLSPAGSRTAYFDYRGGAFATPQHTPISVQKQGDFPTFSRLQPGPKTLPLKYTIVARDSEGQFRAISRIFNPDDGEQYLVVLDADDVEKRMLCAPTQIILPEDHDKPLVVPLFAANPLLEATTESSVTDDIVPATNPIALAAQNDGSFRALPTIEIVPRVAKFATEGYEQMSEIAYVNRSEFPMTGPASGTWLLELTGGWDTAAIIDIAAITTNSTTTINIGQGMPFDITVGATAAFDDEGIVMIETGAGEEQFLYEIKDATTFTLTARAQGGTAAAQHNQPFTVHQARMFKDGRDIAVFLDEVKIPDEKVTVDGPDTATTKVWIELADSPAISATVAEDFNFGASGSIIFTTEHPFQRFDYVIWKDDGAGICTGMVISTTPTSILIIIVRNSPVPGATTAPATVYKVLRHIQLAWNFAEAPERPTNPDPPLINTNTSTNLQWHWNTAPIWADGNRRPGGWSRILYSGRADVPELQKNRLAVKTTLDVTGTAIRFTDAEPSADAPNYDAVEFRSPWGIDDVAGAVEYDASIEWPFALQIIGRDLLGLEELIFVRWGHEGIGAVAHNFPVVEANRQETPGDILQAVILRARNMIVTGIDSGVLVQQGLVEVGEDFQLSQAFTLREDTSVSGVVVKCRDPSTGTKDLRFVVSTKTPSGAPGVALSSIFQYNVLLAAFQELCAGPDTNFSVPLVLPSGEYQLEIYETAGTGTPESAASGGPMYALGDVWLIIDGAWTQQPQFDAWFAILSYLVDNQEEVLEGPRTGEVTTVDDITIVFDPDRIPFATMRAAETAYHIDTTISRGTESFRVEMLRRWANNEGQDEIVRINVAERLVEAEFFGGSLVSDVRQILSEETEDPWLTLPAGASTISAEAAEDAQQEGYTMTYRSTWLA